MLVLTFNRLAFLHLRDGMLVSQLLVSSMETCTSWSPFWNNVVMPVVLLIPSPGRDCIGRFS